MSKKHKPADKIQDLQFFGEFGGVNPSITDSSTFTYLEGKTMEEVFEGEKEGCYLYSRHINPSNQYLGKAIAEMENYESAIVTSSGMAAISSVIMQICSSGDNIISSDTVYGGTYAFFKNFLPKFNIKSSFFSVSDFESIENAIDSKTKLIYCESMSNPLLDVANISRLSDIAKKHDIKLVVDNTFCPLIFTPKNHGADVVIHSLTKFINGSSDIVGGVICSDLSFIRELIDVNSGSSMLLGPTMDSFRSSSVLKNLRTLHIRMKQHSYNAMFLAEKLKSIKGLGVCYPGLSDHKDHVFMKGIMNFDFGFGGLLNIDVGGRGKANSLMEIMQENNVGYLAVSLGFYKTLFTAPGSSTSSEMPEESQNLIGISPGMIRMSVGLDNDIERTFRKIKKCISSI